MAQGQTPKTNVSTTSSNHDSMLLKMQLPLFFQIDQRIAIKHHFPDDVTLLEKGPLPTFDPPRQSTPFNE